MKCAPSLSRGKRVVDTGTTLALLSVMAMHVSSGGRPDQETRAVRTGEAAVTAASDPKELEHLSVDTLLITSPGSVSQLAWYVLLRRLLWFFFLNSVLTAAETESIFYQWTAELIPIQRR